MLDVNTLKLFFGGSPDEVRDAYKAWWDQQDGKVELVCKPTIVQEGRGWKLTVWYRPFRRAKEVPL